MTIEKYFWDLNQAALKQAKRILKNPKHPKFISRMVALLSRCEQPKELFSLVSQKEFIEAWPKIKAHWQKIARESDFRDWWQAIYEQLLEKYGKKQRRSQEERSLLFLKIGKVIKEARIQKGLSQKELSALVGVRQPDISKIEEGKKNITLKTFFALSGALNIKRIDLS
jgi:DNA-binding XRE family transcriptional regulator